MNEISIKRIDEINAICDCGTAAKWYVKTDQNRVGSNMCSTCVVDWLGDVIDEPGPVGTDDLCFHDETTGQPVEMPELVSRLKSAE